MSASSRARVLLLRAAPRLRTGSPALMRRAPLCSTAAHAAQAGASGVRRWYSPSSNLVRDVRSEEGDDVELGKKRGDEKSEDAVATQAGESESGSEPASVESGESTADSETSSIEGSESESAAASQTSEITIASETSVPDSEQGKATAAAHTTSNFAFAFDIDGVLLHSSKPLPGATQTLKFLQSHNIPFILLTNGGGKSEAERVAELSAKLGVGLDTSNFVQSHTPFQLAADLQDSGRKVFRPQFVRNNLFTGYLKRTLGFHDLRNSTVLVLGSDASKARHIAHGYGFKSVVTPGDILKACPEIFPFNPLHEFYDKQEILPLPKPIYDPRTPNVKLEDCLKIDAILVFNDPRDWALDIQLVTDLMVSHRGYLGTYSRKNRDLSLPRHERWQGDGQPALVFSNCDLLWSTGYHMPRYGQGAFRVAVMSAFRQVAYEAIVAAGESEPRKVPKFKHFELGKPCTVTYGFAENILHRYSLSLLKKQLSAEAGPGGTPAGKSGDRALRAAFRVENVYMVGDNPESDIRGANRRRNANQKLRTANPPSARPLWTSCLVKTGVWSEDQTPVAKLPEEARPDVVQPDVKSTVNWVLEKHGWSQRVA